ncbi:YCF48-related protein [Tenacibaculum sp. ZS6-P6]|uniref:YCF48-related protein n=1 Tax=Tenacibaculum sp. ZS6-P6 TaxID=3447503 RepID=UPI003F98E512
MREKVLFLLCTILCFSKIQSQTNWELLNPKPTVNRGKVVEFVTPDIGFIITANELLETTDAGNTWLKKQNISSGNDMSFYNGIGYIVGSGGYVLKSNDNGASWSEISTGVYGNFNAVSIIDNNNIILSTSNSILSTDDGGVTWKNFSIPNSSVNKTFFTSHLIGHAITNNGFILKTIDGGQNWYATKDDSNTMPSNFYTIDFVNENVGFVTQAHDDIYKTTDAGETWIEMSTRTQTIFDFHFLDENNGFATGEYGATYKTNDGGNSWNQIFFQSGFFEGTSMYSIYFQDNNIGYATGERGRIIKTTDGGNTWSSHSENYNSFSDLKIFDSGTGFVRSGGNYYKTTDFGDNWSYISSVNHFSYCSGSYFVSENLGYSIGGGIGDVFKTTDGGVSWDKLDINVDEGLRSIFFINNNVGFISGGFNQKKVMKTTNGGNTWSQVSDQLFGNIQFTSDLVGYGNRKGNSYGAIYKTIDGGNTWRISVELEGEDINDFHFVDENNGYFVGDQGLIYKTNDGGTNWEKLKIPYEWYTQVKFYSKNIGYVADEDGLLYKTQNGGISWEYVTNQYKINSIEVVNDKIYTAGTNGKIYRSDIEYETIILIINSIENVSNSSVKLTGNITSNGAPVSNIQFEYYSNSSNTNVIPVTPANINSNESLNVAIDLSELKSNTTYYFNLSGVQNSNISYSQTLSFTTLPDYEINTNFPDSYSAVSAEVSSNIVSNEHDITNIVFEYGLSSDDLTNTVVGIPDSVKGKTSETITGSLVNLQPLTKYFYRIKAQHEGENIYGEIKSFTTYPEYIINLYDAYIDGTNVTFSAHLLSYNESIEDIVFEYGTIDYENSIEANPSEINAFRYSLINTTITDLDSSLNYYYRLKATHNGETIYSEEKVFNFSGDIIMVSGSIEETQTNSLELKGLINSRGAYLTDIYFEYGLTDSFGETVDGSPNYVLGNRTNSIKGVVDNPLPNQTYYYRLVATNNGNKIYSETYNYRMSDNTLSSNEFDFKNNISIYPNPTKDFVNIKSNTPEKVKSIHLYNSLGQEIYYKKIDNNVDMQIDLSSYGTGLYFVKVNFENSKKKISKLILK